MWHRNFIHLEIAFAKIPFSEAWRYKRNGAPPNKSAARYQLQDFPQGNSLSLSISLPARLLARNPKNGGLEDEFPIFSSLFHFISGWISSFHVKRCVVGTCCCSFSSWASQASSAVSRFTRSFLRCNKRRCNKNDDQNGPKLANASTINSWILCFWSWRFRISSVSVFWLPYQALWCCKVSAQQINYNICLFWNLKDFFGVGKLHPTKLQICVFTVGFFGTNRTAWKVRLMLWDLIGSPGELDQVTNVKNHWNLGTK